MRVTTLSLCGALVLIVAIAADAGQESQLRQDAEGKIPAGARVFIGPIENGYDIYLAAAMHKKEVPIVIVTDRGKADFELSGVSESEKAGWAKIVFWGNTSSNEQASVKMVNLKSGTVVWGYNVNKGSSARGKQSSAEACAKHLKEKIEKGA
jgi:hypothetical protein